MDQTEAAAGIRTNENPKNPEGGLVRPVRRGQWIAAHPIELLVVAGFLVLVFILGLFPLKDTDFWWHLRTGDWIRSEGRVPRTDLYTYTAPDAPWIDLHWGFQVLLSIGYALGGIELLTIAKCVITTAAMAVLLLGCRKRGWPLWVSVLGWLPALLVLSGRMYIRPETVSLWWLSLVMLVIFHWRETPRIMYLLPVIFLFWVNTQGIFVLGFVMVGMGLIDVASSPASWRREQRDWWNRAVACLGMSVIACLINPYGFRGLFFPLSLAGTMRNPVFRTIGELTPIPQFIQGLGIRNFPSVLGPGNVLTAIKLSVLNFASFPLPLKLHLLTIVLGVLSLVVPIGAGFYYYLKARVVYEQGMAENEEAKKAVALETTRRRRKAAVVQERVLVKPELRKYVQIRPFRWLMTLFFSYLSLQATRNSHQFAAVVGTMTASNLAEMALMAKTARGERLGKGRRPLSAGNAVALAAVVLMLVWVGTGQYFADCGEGRVLGMGEEPLWYPHEAVKAAGQEGLPKKLASFHNGHAALYDYYWGPERKVFSDARLEVIGPNLYQDQMRLSNALNRSEPNWRGLVAKAERPLILADHVTNSGVSVTLMAANDYECIHFDPIGAVFAPSESMKDSAALPFDVLSAHYSAEGFRARNQDERHALARAMRNIAGGLGANGRDDLARPMTLAGVGLASTLVAENGTLIDGWKLLGQLLQLGVSGSQVERERAPDTVDPIADLANVRGIHALKRALELKPDDFSSLFSLAMVHKGLLQLDLELECLNQLVRLTPINATQATEIENAKGRIVTVKQLMGLDVTPSKVAADQNKLPEGYLGSLAKPLPNMKASRAEMERDVNFFLKTGQTVRAVENLNLALPVSEAPPELLEKLGGMWLWQGRPEEARAAYGRIQEEPRRQMLMAVCAMVMNDRQEALKQVEEARKQVGKLAEEDSLRFAIPAMRAQIAMEEGDSEVARRSLGEARRYATAPGERDTVERMMKNVPAVARAGRERE